VNHRLPDDFVNLRDLIDAHERIDFGQQLGQVVAETLRETAGDNERLAAVASLADFGGFAG